MYPVGQKARYVRLTFPGGAAGEQMDILEVRVMGYDGAEVLSTIASEKTLNADKDELTLEISGYTGLGEKLDMTEAAVTVTSSDETVAVVEGNVIQAVAEVTVRIDLAVEMYGFAGSETFVILVLVMIELVLIVYLA